MIHILVIWSRKDSDDGREFFGGIFPMHLVPLVFGFMASDDTKKTGSIEKVACCLVGKVVRTPSFMVIDELSTRSGLCRR